MKTLQWGTKLFHVTDRQTGRQTDKQTDGQTDSHDEANSRLFNLLKRLK
jgi:hypothetical protein